MPIPLDLGKPDSTPFFVLLGDNLFRFLPPDTDDDEYSGFNKWTVRKPTSGLTAMNLLFPCGITARERLAYISRPRDSERPEPDHVDGLYCIEAQVHFIGELVDGTQIVSTRENGVPLRFLLGQGKTINQIHNLELPPPHPKW
uniref:Uncharacterized protein n=1 Tax=Oryza brachyantha TaxID=4533 RepID=J3L142_ORYBR